MILTVNAFIKNIYNKKLKFKVNFRYSQKTKSKKKNFKKIFDCLKRILIFIFSKKIIAQNKKTKKKN